MDELTVKFGMLEPFRRKELMDFLDFLLSKQTEEKKNSLTTYKERILQVSIWSEEDIAEINSSQKNAWQWQVPEW